MLLENRIRKILDAIWMEPLNSTKPDVPKWLIFSGLVLLIAGMLFGLVGSFQYIFPGLFKQYLSFEKIRPLHVSSVVFWILFAATGSVLAYLQEHTKRKLFAGKASSLQLKLFVLAVVLILSSYVLGKFGGREYWEFPPPLALILAAGWILFIIQVAGSTGVYMDVAYRSLWLSVYIHRIIPVGVFIFQ